MTIESGTQSPIQIGNNNAVNYVFNVIVENRHLAVIAGLLAVAFVVLFFKKGDTKRIKQKQKSGKNSVNLQVGGNVEINKKDV